MSRDFTVQITHIAVAKFQFIAIEKFAPNNPPFQKCLLQMSLNSFPTLFEQ